ncbi:VOC family protein [Haloglycomyces albus]|uniref:VOC family protein n=1 Tax=Haloglycomyces albus TaxID=526067 RepID=UPI00046D1636|nr:VOC family protein [Haloglycomyces albus]
MTSIDARDGAPVWLDVSSNDIDASAEFYRALFGWEFMSAGPEAGGYGMFTLNNQIVAALGPCQKSKPAWQIFFQTSDITGTVDRANQAGGDVRAEPMEVFTEGTLAELADPQGAPFSLWQGRDTAGVDVMHVPGAATYFELYTGDSAGAQEFYRSVFDWSYSDHQLPPGIASEVYTHVTAQGADNPFAGIFQLPSEMLPAGPYWQPYFQVEDVDATIEIARNKGASIMMGPKDIPDAGRIAIMHDEQTATFGILAPARR